MVAVGNSYSLARRILQVVFEKSCSSTFSSILFRSGPCRNPMAAAESTEGTTTSWLPLESNPEVLNPFIRRLGVPEDVAFCDVFGLDPELLMMVPQPCFALCLLFPSPKISPVRRQELREKVASEGGAKRPSDVFFIQQVGLSSLFPNTLGFIDF